ncbi:hypothetical protein [Alistipes sp.]|uniref:hypothetical protein n=1 Tax=Alistipes sp. TaxID=1872444 RepID=UPI003AF12DE8
MGCYFVLAKKDDCNILLLEDLSSHRQMEVEQVDSATFIRDSKEKSQILKILPPDFFLSPFTNGKIPYVFDGEQILFNILAVMQPFTLDSKITPHSIVGLSEWQLLK